MIVYKVTGFWLNKLFKLQTSNPSNLKPYKPFKLQMEYSTSQFFVTLQTSNS